MWWVSFGFFGLQSGSCVFTAEIDHGLDLQSRAVLVQCRADNGEF